MNLPLLKSGMPSTPSDPTLSAAGRNTRCRVTGMAKNRTTTPKATTAHIQARWLGRLSEICMLRGPEACDAGAGVAGADEAIPTCEEPDRLGSLPQTSSSFSKSAAHRYRSL